MDGFYKHAMYQGFKRRHQNEEKLLQEAQDTLSTEDAQQVQSIKNERIQALEFAKLYGPKFETGKLRHLEAGSVLALVRIVVSLLILSTWCAQVAKADPEVATPPPKKAKYEEVATPPTKEEKCRKKTIMGDNTWWNLPLKEWTQTQVSPSLIQCIYIFTST